MKVGDRVLYIDGEILREGTSLYDTVYDRVLWIVTIDDTGVTVETAHDYRINNPVGWTSDGSATHIKDGTIFNHDEFQSLVTDGRFEVNSQYPDHGT